MPSKRHIRIERLWGEVNPKMLFAVKQMLIQMEAAGFLSLLRDDHTVAVQLLLLPLLQGACDDFRAIWNHARVRSSKGHGGVPAVMRAQYPHPKGSMLPVYDPRVDVVGRYERIAGTLPRPDWLAMRDPLHGQPGRQAARSVAIMHVWGTMQYVWEDIMHTQGQQRFVPSFFLFIGFR